MANARNTFIKSKMNKDLDDRLLSKGEYRDAENVQVSRSEGEDVGALENILGNTFLGDWGLGSIPNLEIIGHTIDESSESAYFIATNYVDTSVSTLDNVAPYGASCYILGFDNKQTNPLLRFRILVEGSFLNFSKTHPVTGIDLLEKLLFWTDDRNQPRKINVDFASISANGQGYYNTEDQISVAKYYPYQAPILWNEVCIGNITTSGSSATIQTNDDTKNLIPGMALVDYPNAYIKTVSYTSPYSFVLTNIINLAGSNTLCFIDTSSKNVTDQFLTPSIFGQVNDDESPTTTSFGIYKPVNTTVFTNMQITCPSAAPRDSKRIITSVTPAGTSNQYLSITVDKPFVTSEMYIDGQFVEIAWPNPNYISSWPGDEEFLTDKFVRFAYRFKFDDGEFSLISPFTQPAFIPNNKGYIPSRTFPGTKSQDDGNDVLTDVLSQVANSTVLDSFENSVNQVRIKLPLPTTQGLLSSVLKITEVQVLYRESNALSIQVLEEFKVSDFDPSQSTSASLIYNYQSKNPFRTLPSKEVGRVFDKVPIRAKSQSISGNRVIYGNFIDKHSPPKGLDYSTSISEKYEARSSSNFNIIGTSNYSSNCSMAYPIHNVKQNRTYQIGIVLADRYGRQSDVILSNDTVFQISQDGGNTNFDSSTLYNPYSKGRFGSGSIRPEDWKGDSIKILFSGSGIPSLKNNPQGYPGIYKAVSYKFKTSSEVISSNVISISDGSLPSLKGFPGPDTYWVPVSNAGPYNTLEAGAGYTFGSGGGTAPLDLVYQTGFSGNGSGAKLQITSLNGFPFQLSSAQGIVTDGGSGYEIGDKLCVVGNGSSFSGKINSTVNAAQLNAQPVNNDFENISVGDIVTGPQSSSGNLFTAAINSIDYVNKTITVNKTLSIPNSSDLTVYTQENKLGWYSYKVVVKQLAEEYYNAYLGNFSTVLLNAKIQGTQGTSPTQNFINTYVTTLVSDNVNKIPADLGAVAPEQNQFGTSDTRLNIRVGGDYRAVTLATGVGTFYPKNFYFGTSTAGIQGYGKVLDMGLSTSDTDPNTSGLFLSGSNPPAIIVKGANDEIFGGVGEFGVILPNTFSVAEIVPRVSKLEIYWETSTSGLVSELNARIAAGESVLPTQPEVPPEPEQ